MLCSLVSPSPTLVRLVARHELGEDLVHLVTDATHFAQGHMAGREARAGLAVDVESVKAEAERCPPVVAVKLGVCCIIKSTLFQ